MDIDLTHIDITELLRKAVEHNQEYDEDLEDVMNDFFAGDPQDYDRLCFWISMYPQYREELEDAHVTSCIMPFVQEETHAR